MKNPSTPLLLAAAIAAAVIAAAPALDAKVKVRTQFDQKFDFKTVRTWAWASEHPGAVMLARSANEDKEAFLQRVDPVVREAVGVEMLRRKMQPAQGAPDVTLTFYVLMMAGPWTQSVGQFVPSVPEWGLPIFQVSTSAIEVIEQGALVIDMSAGGQPVWRGVAEAGINPDTDQKKRTVIVKDAVRKLLEKFPPRK